MSFEFEDLYPRKVSLVLGSKVIDLSFLTLRHTVTFQSMFGSTAEMLEAANKDDKNLKVILWTLAENKDDLEKVENSFLFNSEDALKALNEVVYKSMPLVKNKKRASDIRLMQQSQTDEDPCCVSYYDTIAKRYGYTLDQFYDLTLRQLHMLLNKINEKVYDEVELQAKLNGREMKPRMNYKDISVEEEKSQEKEAMDSFERLKREYEKNKDK